MSAMIAVCAGARAGERASLEGSLFPWILGRFELSCPVGCEFVCWAAENEANPIDGPRRLSIS